ncbi:MAG: two-component regulator propeller domain-containing protein, partial [Opitutaceae bacterium]
MLKEVAMGPANIAVSDLFTARKLAFWSALGLVCAFWAGLASTAFAAAPEAIGESGKGEDYFFDSFGLEVGMPQSNVISILQTTDGYLWVGTEGGLGRFDGVRFVSFKMANTPAFLSQSIRCLFEDKEGNLWIGTAKGVLCYRGGIFTRIGLSDAAITCIVEDRHGTIWIGTNEHGLYSWQDGQMQSYAHEPSMPSPSVASMYIDSSDRLWIGFWGDLYVVYRENGVFRKYTGEGRFGTTKQSDSIQTICEQPKGTIWFGSNQGLFRLKDGKLSHYTIADGLAGPLVTELRPAGDGGLWIVSAAGVLEKAEDPDHFSAVAIPFCPYQTVMRVCEDREGNLWMGARENGLIRARPMPYQPIYADHSPPFGGVKTVSQDPAGNFWGAVAHRGAVKLAPDGKATVYTEADGLFGHDPWVVYPARDGSIWIGARDGLVILRDGKTWKKFPELPQSRSLFQDRRGRMWVGSSTTGLSCYDGGRFINVALPGGPTSLSSPDFP